MSFVAWKYIFTYAVEGEFPQIKFGELFSLFDRMCCWGGGGGAWIFLILSTNCKSFRWRSLGTFIIYAFSLTTAWVFSIRPPSDIIMILWRWWRMISIAWVMPLIKIEQNDIRRWISMAYLSWNETQFTASPCPQPPPPPVHLKKSKHSTIQPAMQLCSLYKHSLHDEDGDVDRNNREWQRPVKILFLPLISRSSQQEAPQFSKMSIRNALMVVMLLLLMFAGQLIIFRPYSPPSSYYRPALLLLFLFSEIIEKELLH